LCAKNCWGGGGGVNLPKREHDQSANLTGVAYSAHSITSPFPKIYVTQPRPTLRHFQWRTRNLPQISRCPPLYVVLTPSYTQLVSKICGVCRFCNTPRGVPPLRQPTDDSVTRNRFGEKRRLFMEQWNKEGCLAGLSHSCPPHTMENRHSVDRSHISDSHYTVPVIAYRYSYSYYRHFHTYLFENKN